MSTPQCPAPAVRHKERRRTATCAFGNRIATVSVEHYRRIVTKPPPATCVATIVCHDAATDKLTVLAMGVGTKFMIDDGVSRLVPYGERVRDCHAEVLVRRAWRRYLTNAIQRLDRDSDAAPCLLLEKQVSSTSISPTYRLRPGFTLHFYCSSAPCGNAVIKKFATFSKEVYDPNVPSNTWPEAQHPELGAHSIPLGQLALLIKQKPSPPSPKDDVTSPSTGRPSRPLRYSLTRKQSTWPIYTSVSWCPPGTTPVWNIPRETSSSHTCSDKLARWHVLGWQGSLLHPFTGRVVPDTLTIGRKFAAVTAARALCCRTAHHSIKTTGTSLPHKHPTLLGTNVYLDDGAQTVTDSPRRFHDSNAWVSWYNDQKQAVDPRNNDADPTEPEYTVECIDAYTGLVAETRVISAVSTVRLVHDLRRSENSPFRTLLQLREWKRTVSRVYEQQKDELLSSRHPVFRDWCRREHDHDDAPKEE